SRLFGCERNLQTVFYLDWWFLFFFPSLKWISQRGFVLPTFLGYDNLATHLSTIRLAPGGVFCCCCFHPPGPGSFAPNQSGQFSRIQLSAIWLPSIFELARSEFTWTPALSCRTQFR